MNDVVKAKSFEEKMKDRIKDSIGDLIDDEALSKLIERGIEEAFFKPAITYNSYGSPNGTKEPFIYPLVRELIKGRVNEKVDEWIKENPEKIQETLNEILKMGVGGAVIEVLNNKLNSDLFMFKNSIEQRLLNN